MLTDNGISISACLQADLIASISRQSFYDTFASHNREEDMQLFMDHQFHHQMLVDEVNSGKHLFFLASVNNEPAGYFKLTLHHHPDLPSTLPAMEIGRFYALSSFIGKGVGKAMMQKIFQLAHEKEVRQIWLGVWEKNERAIQFYASFGFQIFSQHPFLLGRDVQTDWLMYRLM